MQQQLDHLCRPPAHDSQQLCDHVTCQLPIALLAVCCLPHSCKLLHGCNSSGAAAAAPHMPWAHLLLLLLALLL